MPSLKTSEYPNREPSFPGLSQAQLLMYVGLASLTVLFGASLVAYFVTRAQATAWRSIDLPTLPWGVWVSSAVLVVLSLSLRYGVRRIANNSYRGLTQGLLTALCLSFLFLVVQAYNWREVLVAAFSNQQKGLYVYTFFMLTVLHALHVVAGMIPLALVYRRSLQQYYSSSRKEGVVLLRQYWDFLLIIWFVLLGALGLS